jgi:hypothetical protein
MVKRRHQQHQYCCALSPLHHPRRMLIECIRCAPSYTVRSACRCSARPSDCSRRSSVAAGGADAVEAPNGGRRSTRTSAAKGESSAYGVDPIRGRTPSVACVHTRRWLVSRAYTRGGQRARRQRGEGDGRRGGRSVRPMRGDEHTTLHMRTPRRGVEYAHRIERHILLCVRTSDHLDTRTHRPRIGGLLPPRCAAPTQSADRRVRASAVDLRRPRGALVASVST